MGERPIEDLKPSGPVRTPLRAMPGGIWALGFVSMFMDISSELVHSLLPIFMSTVLGTSMVTIGVIEGVAEGTASITKLFSGALSDYFRRRKLLALLGYSLGALSKPIFPLAGTIGWVFAARFVDRVGKGIRGAPRDALVADIAPPELRGAAYGLRQSLDSAGAFIGPVLALLLMIGFANDIKAVLWFAALPGVIAVGLLAIAVSEPKEPVSAGGRRIPLTLADARRLPRRYWLIVLLGATFTLARFSEAFLLLRAQEVGLAIGYVPAIMIVMNLVYASAAFPAGIASDWLSPRSLLVAGLLILVAADGLLAAARAPGPVLVGAALWGLHMGLTQGLLSKLVADTAPVQLRGTAFGLFNLVSGIALLLASVVAGALWDRFGSPAAFVAGATFAGLAAIGLVGFRSESRSL